MCGNAWLPIGVRATIDGMTRTSLRLLVALVLSLAAVGVAHAQSDTPTTPTDASADALTIEPDDVAPLPIGPRLEVASSAPMVCDAGAGRMRYVEVRGNGFDAWAGQRLVGTLTDATGVARAQWPSVWVTPTGRVTVEVNICADAFRNQGALPPGDYSLAVGSSGSGPVAVTGFSLQAPAPPPDSATPADDTNPPD